MYGFLSETNMLRTDNKFKIVFYIQSCLCGSYNFDLRPERGFHLRRIELLDLYHEGIFATWKSHVYVW